MHRGNRTISATAKAACFDGHATRSARDDVFSALRT